MRQSVVAALTIALTTTPSMASSGTWTVLSDVQAGAEVGLPTVLDPTPLKDGSVSFWTTFFIRDASGEHFRTTRTVAKCDEQLFSLRYVNDRTIDGKMIPGRTVDDASTPLRYEQAAPDTVTYGLLRFVCANADERQGNPRWIPLPSGMGPLDVLATIRGRASKDAW